MTRGRMEQCSKMEKKILDRLEMMPECMFDYYYSLTALKKESNTKYAYINHVFHFLQYCAENFHKPVKEIDESDIRKINTSMIDRYIITKRECGEKQMKDRTMYLILSAMQSFFRFLMTHDYIEKDPLNGKFEKPKIDADDEIVYMTIEEISTVLNNIRTRTIGDAQKARTEDWIERDMLLFLIPLYTGIRNSALCSINVEDICFEENSFVGTDKGGRTSVYYFDDQIKELMSRYMTKRERKLDGAECSAFFISKTLGRISPRSVARIIEKYTFNIDKHITPHKLRSTCATTMYTQTHDIYLVQKILGHSSPTTTKRYTELTKDRRREAAEIMSGLIQVI